MKKLILTFAICLGLAFTADAQTIKKDAAGNYVQVKKDSLSTVSKSAQTGQTFTDFKGNVYPVMKGSKGGLFYVRTSKAGKEYNVYLKAN